MNWSATRTRSTTSSCTRSRVKAVLDLFLGDAVALHCRGLISKERLHGWVRDLIDVLVLEAVERFQIKLTFPTGRQIAIDYEVSDDGTILGDDSCGGFSVHWLPAGTAVSLVLRWRENAPGTERARQLLRARGWGAGSMMSASGNPDHVYSLDGYGFKRRMVGEWQT